MNEYYLIYKFSSIVNLIVSLGVFVWANYESIFVKWKYNSSEVFWITSLYLFGGILVCLVLRKHQLFFENKIAQSNQKAEMIDEVLSSNEKVINPDHTFLNVAYSIITILCLSFLIYMCFSCELFKHRVGVFYIIRDIIIVSYTLLWLVQLINSVYLIRLANQKSTWK